MNMDTRAERKDVLVDVKMDPAVLDVHVSLDSGLKKQFQEKQELNENRTSETKSEKFENPSFEDLMNRQKAALFSLAPHQFELILKYVGILRMQRLLAQKQLECGFCKNNGSPVSWYSSHILKDKRGRVRCPILREYRCPACGDTGDYAHTLKYCPLAVPFMRDRVGRGR